MTSLIMLFARRVFDPLTAVRAVRRGGVLLLTLTITLIASAEPTSPISSWPQKQVKIVVPYPTGSGPDVLARVLAQGLVADSGQTAIVENRRGANGMIGASAVARAPGDGNTLLLMDRLALITNPALYASVPFDWRRDLKPVSDMGRVHLYLVVGDRLPIKTYADFVRYAKTHPGALNYGSGGIGHIGHLSMEAIARSEGLTLNHIPYASLLEAAIAIVNGDVAALVTGPIPVLGMIRDGRLRAIAVGSDRRTAEMPEAPTLQEIGAATDLLPPTIFTLYAPGSTPEWMVDLINARVTAILRKPGVAASISAQALEAVPSTPRAALEDMERLDGSTLKKLRDMGIKRE